MEQISNKLITLCTDTENYLISFFDFRSFIAYTQLSKIHYSFIKKHTLGILLSKFPNKLEKKLKMLIGWAGACGYIDILNLIKPVKNYYSAIKKLAIKHGKCETLQWLIDHGYESYFYEEVIDGAAEYGHIHIIKWFQNAGFEFRYFDFYKLDPLKKRRLLPVSDLPTQLQKGVVPQAIPMKKHKREIYYTNAIDKAARNGHIDILQWFKDAELEFKYTSNAIDGAAANGHINVLEWFCNSELEFKYTPEAIYNAEKNQHYDILEWFATSRLKFKYDYNSLDAVLISLQLNVMDVFEKYSTKENKHKSLLDYDDDLD